MKEGKAFYDLKQTTLERNKDATPEKRTEALRLLGPPSASQFAAVVEKLALDKPGEADPAFKHWEKVKELDEHLKSQSNWHDAARIAGTWQTKRAHGTRKKFVAKPDLPKDQCLSVITLLRRAGLTVHYGEKAPRDGLHRAVQGIIQ